MKKHARGFTLIEMMVVVASIAILAAVAIPSYIEYLGRVKVMAAIAESSHAKNNIDIWLLDEAAADDLNKIITIAAKLAAAITTHCNYNSTPAITATTVALVCKVVGGPGGADGKFVTWTRHPGGGWGCATTSSQKLAGPYCIGVD